MTLPYEQLRYLDRLAAHGQQSESIRLAESTLKTQYDDRLVSWLLEQLRSRGDRADELHWQRVRMREQPTKENYEALISAVENPAQRDSVHQEVVKELHLSGRYDVLTRVYLSEGEWAKAWDSFAARSKKNIADEWLYSTVERELVEQTRHLYPDRALRFYLASIQKHIDQRSRDNYRLAAEELVIVRDLYRALNDDEGWQNTFLTLRTTYSRLPAFQDELRQAGLK